LVLVQVQDLNEVIQMDMISILSKTVLQTIPSIEERVLPTMIFAAIVVVALLAYGAMKKNKGAVYAGIVLLIGVLFAYVRFLTPYLPNTYNAGMGTVLFNAGGVDVTVGTIGAIIFLIVVVAILVWYRKSRVKRSQ
jgi:hypothetical protein